MLRIHGTPDGQNPSRLSPLCTSRFFRVNLAVARNTFRELSGKATYQELANQLRTNRQKKTTTKPRPKIILWLRYTKSHSDWRL